MTIFGNRLLQLHNRLEKLHNIFIFGMAYPLLFPVSSRLFAELSHSSYLQSADFSVSHEFRSSSQGTFASWGPLIIIRQRNKYVNKEIYSGSCWQDS